MPFRFYSTGQVSSIVIILALSSIAFAQLDWDNDVVVFGTDMHEADPQMVSIGGGQYRAFCLSNWQVLRTRRSLIHGEAWESFREREVGVDSYGFSVAADAQYAYVAHPSYRGYVIRIAHSSQDWNDNTQIDLYPEVSRVYSVAILTDAAFDPVDTYLHGFAAYVDSTDVSHFAYFRSEDHGQSIAAQAAISGPVQVDEMTLRVAGAYTWSDDDERLWGALSVDRPGSIGEQVLLYYSDDLGSTWSAPFEPDSSSYSQLRPALIGYGETLVLAYERRTNASIATDIFVVYSPDNGVSWSEPLQLTDHPFNDSRPDLELSGGYIGLFYGRSPIQENEGQILFRQSTVSEPWVWEDEVEVSTNDDALVADGFSAAGNSDGFAVVWTGRLVGNDVDVLFDASWRGASIDSPRGTDEAGEIFSFNPAMGWIEYELPRGAQLVATLYDVLGRTVNRTLLTDSQGIWRIPSSIPSGTYILSAETAAPLKIQIAR